MSATRTSVGAAAVTARSGTTGSTRAHSRPRFDAHPLRIALLCPVWFPVPPPSYGGIEAVVALLAESLTHAGHDVTVFASGDSRTHATLSWVYLEAPSDHLGDPLIELRHVLSCYERADEFDVVSDHTGPMAAALGQLSAPPVVHTVHGPLDGELGEAYEQIARVSPRVGLISLSRNQRRPHPSLPWLANCPNAIDPSLFSWSRTRGDYLAFLGRMGPDKGCHHAIAAAQATGLPLKIAAKCREPAERAYFAERIEPHLGGTIEYVGELGHIEKVALLRNAKATLFPIDWEEPFGLVMIESLACGTPVVAIRRGSVPEVVEHGRTGIIVDDHDQLPEAIAEVDRIDPAECRRAAEERFSPGVLVANYLRAFRAAIEAAVPSSVAALIPIGAEIEQPAASTAAGGDQRLRREARLASSQPFPSQRRPARVANTVGSS
jgi:glycosyltransferase involved in cell wall biosynthesis